MPIFKKRNKNAEESDEIIISETADEGDERDERNERDETELIAVITAAIAMILKKPASGFKVVSFKKRNNWKNII